MSQLLTQCSQIQSVDIGLPGLNSNGMGVLTINTRVNEIRPLGSRKHPLRWPLGEAPKLNYTLSTKTHDVWWLHTYDATVLQMERPGPLGTKEKTPAEFYINTAFYTNKVLPVTYSMLYWELNVSSRLNDVETLHLKKAVNGCFRLRLLTLLPQMQVKKGTLSLHHSKLSYV